MVHDFREQAEPGEAQLTVILVVAKVLVLEGVQSMQSYSIENSSVMTSLCIAVTGRYNDAGVDAYDSKPRVGLRYYRRVQVGIRKRPSVENTTNAQAKFLMET